MALTGKRYRHGVTLLELLVALALLSTLLTFAAPAFSDWSRRSEIRASTGHFRQMLDAGRYLALAENNYVTLCPLDAAGACASQWQRSVQMFVDVNGDGRRDAVDKLLHGNVDFPEGTWLIWKSFRNKPYIQWAPAGRTNSLNGTFTLCNREARPEWITQWVISRAGRVRMILPAPAGKEITPEVRRLCG